VDRCASSTRGPQLSVAKIAAVERLSQKLKRYDIRSLAGSIGSVHSVSEFALFSRASTSPSEELAEPHLSSTRGPQLSVAKIAAVERLSQKLKRYDIRRRTGGHFVKNQSTARSLAGSIGSVHSVSEFALFSRASTNFLWQKSPLLKGFLRSLRGMTYGDGLVEILSLLTTARSLAGSIGSVHSVSEFALFSRASTSPSEELGVDPSNSPLFGESYPRIPCERERAQTNESKRVQRKHRFRTLCVRVCALFTRIDLALGRTCGAPLCPPRGTQSSSQSGPMRILDKRSATFCGKNRRC
jgi:hypothetical protein